MAFHNGASAKMKLNGEIIKGENIPLNEGLIQGSNGAPLLFLLFFATLWMVIISKLKGKGIKYRVMLGEEICDEEEITFFEFMFADDVALTADNEKDMQEIMLVVEEVSIMFGMEVSYIKTEIMFQQSNIGKLLGEPKIRNFNGDIYKVVDFFKYLGIHISVMKRKEENGGVIFCQWSIYCSMFEAWGAIFQF